MCCVHISLEMDFSKSRLSLGIGGILVPCLPSFRVLDAAMVAGRMEDSKTD
jgi:hypothetical protein